MTLFNCPICQHPLTREEKRLVCEAAHSFDISRNGYVNLLPSHHRKSKSPGDSVEMVQARRRFLEGGYYDPLADLIVQMLAASADFVHADLGCGEGHFSHYLSSVAKRVYGIDIS